MKLDILEIEQGLLDENSISDYKASIYLEDFENEEKQCISKNFIHKNEFLKGLFTIDFKSPNIKIEEEKKTHEEVLFSNYDNIIVRGWKNVENISARLIEQYDDTVVLECLIDNEVGIYEEREFRTSLFTGYELEIGNLFLLRIFERLNEVRIEIHNDPELTLKDDFPTLNFVEKFSNSRLFKKK